MRWRGGAGGSSVRGSHRGGAGIRKAMILGVVAVGLGMGGWRRPAHAAWPDSPSTNLPVCTASGEQRFPSAASDSAGGMYVAWEDSRGGATTKLIYLQRILNTGQIAPGWVAQGIMVCPSTGRQHGPKCVSDRHGGVIVAWTGAGGGVSPGGTYAQRFDSAGTIKWAGGGVGFGLTGGCGGLETIEDGRAGVIAAWDDCRNYSVTNPNDIYAGRVDSAGVAVWGAGGVPICTLQGGQAEAVLVSDGAGGAIVAWLDVRDLGTLEGDIYGQRISANGTCLWATNGIPICAAPGRQDSPSIATDHAGGAYVAWTDKRSDPNGDVYLQHILPSGARDPLWPENGLAVAATSAYEMYS